MFQGWADLQIWFWKPFSPLPTPPFLRSVRNGGVLREIHSVHAQRNCLHQHTCLSREKVSPNTWCKVWTLVLKINYKRLVCMSVREKHFPHAQTPFLGITARSRMVSWLAFNPVRNILHMLRVDMFILCFPRLQFGKPLFKQCLFACVLFEVCFPFLWDKKESTPRVRLANEALSIATPPFFPPPSVKCFGDWSGPGLLWHMEGSYFTRPDVEDLQVSVCNVGTAFSGLQAEKKKKKNFPLPIPFLLLFPSLSPLCHYILTTGLFLLPSLLKNATPLRSCSKLPALGGKRISSCWWTLGSEMNLATPMCSANPGRPRELPAAAQEFGVLGR